MVIIQLLISLKFVIISISVTGISLRILLPVSEFVGLSVELNLISFSSHCSYAGFRKVIILFSVLLPLVFILRIQGKVRLK